LKDLYHEKVSFVEKRTGPSLEGGMGGEELKKKEHCSESVLGET